MLLALHQPVLEMDVVLATVTGVDVQLVGAIDGDGLLHVSEKFLVIDDVTVILVVAIQPVSTANGLEQVVVTQLVVQIDVGAAGRIEPR
ncbi:hypothetical protein D9M69_678580 [compost metagenome]